MTELILSLMQLSLQITGNSISIKPVNMWEQSVQLAWTSWLALLGALQLMLMTMVLITVSNLWVMFIWL